MNSLSKEKREEWQKEEKKDKEKRKKDRKKKRNRWVCRRSKWENNVYVDAMSEKRKALIDIVMNESTL